MYEWARPGRKVVCIASVISLVDRQYPEILPQKGIIYTIRNVTPFGNDIGLQFVEIVNETNIYDMNGVAQLGECSFNIKGFRPVVRRETDISIFQQIRMDVEDWKILDFVD